MEWIKQLPELRRFSALRCFKPPRFKKNHSRGVAPKDTSQKLRMEPSVTYTRLVNERRKVHRFLFFGKSRLASIKPLNIPRLELCAAVMAS